MTPLKYDKLIDEKKIAKRIQEMGAEISKLCSQEPLVIVSVLKGSFIFFADLIRAIEGDVACEFLGVSSYDNSMKSSGEVKLTLDLTNSIEGKNVLVVEDIVDTGLTMAYLLKALAAREPKNLYTCSLLLKPGALKTKLKLDYVGFEISNEFVVGYGLDYQGYYRNLPYIAQVNNIN
jgi:hypoxanthine phosphoribosyltransferase